MDVERRVSFVIDELLLDGVEPDDPAVREAIARALAEHPEAEPAAAAVADVVAAEAGR